MNVFAFQQPRTTEQKLAEQIINDCAGDPMLTDMVLQSAGTSDLGQAASQLSHNPEEYHALRGYSLLEDGPDFWDVEPLPAI